MFLFKVFNDSNTPAFHQLVVHPESRVGYFPPTSAAHLNNILASMVKTLKVPNRLQVFRNGVFLPFVLVGMMVMSPASIYGCNSMNSNSILPKLFPGAGALITKDNCKDNR